MSLTRYLILMAISTVLCVVMWIYTLFNINPEQTNALGFSFFYASLALSLIGIFSLLGFGFRKITMKKEVDFRHVFVSFRQSVFISLILIIVLLLQSQFLFTWINVGLLIVVLAGIELFILSKKVSE